MKSVLYLLIMVFSLPAIAQHKTFTECEPSKKSHLFFVVVENPAKFIDSVATLKTIFEKFFKDKISEKKYKGSIIISLFIDKDGSFCCSQIDNLSDVAVDFDDLKNYADSKLTWEPAMQNDREVGSIKLITIIFEKHKIKVTEKN